MNIRISERLNKLTVKSKSSIQSLKLNTQNAIADTTMKRFALSIILFLMAHWCFAQVIFKAQTDTKQTALDSYFEVQFILTNARASDFQPPTFNGFRIMGGPNRSMSTSIINGEYSSTTTFSYILQPTKTGMLTIGSANVKADGKLLKTEPLRIEVLEERSKIAVNRPKANGQEVFLAVEIPVNKIYVGQQIPVNYKLYTITNVNSYNILIEPDYQGFYAEELRRFLSNATQEVVEGTTYTTKILRRMSLFPQQAGRITIGAMEMQVGIVKGRLRDPRDFLFAPDMTRLNITSEPTTIEVLPLPSNAPNSFSGAVGEFTYAVYIPNTDISTDDALSIQLTITGNGDLKRIQAPKLDLGENFELYDPKVKEEFMQEAGDEFQGRKIFEYVVLPKQAGNYSIEVPFSYFDPKQEVYVTPSSEPYVVNIRQGTSVKNLSTAPITTLENDIRHIKSINNLRQPSAFFYGTPTFWGLMGMPMLLLFGVMVYKRVQKQQEAIDPLVLKSRQAQRLAQKHLQVAKEHLQTKSSRAFYDEVSKALLSYVNDKLNITNSALTKHNVADRLASLKVPQSEIEQFMNLMQTCEMAIFARKDNVEAMQKDYDDAVNIIVKVEAAIGK